MTESREITVMRSMEWERVKGSLRAMLVTYYSESSSDVRYEEDSKKIKDFIEDMDNNSSLS